MTILLVTATLIVTTYIVATTKIVTATMLVCWDQQNVLLRRQSHFLCVLCPWKFVAKSNEAQGAIPNLTFFNVTWRSRSLTEKGFVIPTKSFVKIGITKISCYNNKMFGSISKTFGCCGKIFGCSNKNLFVVPNFVAVTKPFFSVLRPRSFLVSAAEKWHYRLIDSGAVAMRRIRHFRLDSEHLWSDA